MPELIADPAAIPAAARGDLAFASALHGLLRKEAGNLFFSPASVRLAMAMTAMGARGKTAEELTAGLGLADDLAQSAAGFAAILDSFAQRSIARLNPDIHTSPPSDHLRRRAEQLARLFPNMRTSHQEMAEEMAERKVSMVAIANRVWPQAGRPFEQSFADVLATRFGAPLQPLDFAAGPEAARRTINAWVAEQTARKIPELLAPMDVTAATRLILTNAIYFKARWDQTFSEDATSDGTFTTAAGGKTPVRMMARTGHMKYAETPAYQLVELPYSDGSLSMTILLPRAGTSLADVEAMALSAPAAPPAEQRVQLQLPRFKIEARFGLTELLAQLGMASAFTDGAADFSGIDGTRELFIGGVVHQAVISVDETGTEAAAATSMVAAAGILPRDPPKPFIADRPFAFFIRDAATGLVLFVGRLADPAAAK